ncbi:MAG: response regulator [Myxococcota bacterium]
MANASVLLIEVDPEYVESLKAIFTQHKLTVHTAGEGHAALRLAEQVSPDLIVLAVELPTINGYIVCKSFKKNERFANVPLFLISSGATARDFKLHQRLRIRANAYFLKPFTPAELWDKALDYLNLDQQAAADEDEELVSPDSSLDQQLGMAFADIFDEPSSTASMTTSPSSDDGLFLSVDASVDGAEALDELEELDALDDIAVEDIAVDDLPVEDLSVGDLEALESIEDVELFAGPAEAELRSEVERLTALLANREQALQDGEGELARLRDALAERDERIDTLNRALEQFREEQDRAPDRSAVDEQQLEQAQARADELEQKLQTERLNWEQERDTMAQEQQRLSDLVRELEDRSETQQQQLSEVQARIAELETQNATLHQELTTAREHQATQHAQMSSLKGAEEETTIRIAELEQQQAEQVRRLQATEEQLTASREAHTALTQQFESAQANHERQRTALEDALKKAHSTHAAVLTNFTALQRYTTALEEHVSSAGRVFDTVNNALIELANRAKAAQDSALPLPDAPALQPVEQLKLPKPTALLDEGAMVVSAEDIVSEEVEQLPPNLPPAPGSFDGAEMLEPTDGADFEEEALEIDTQAIQVDSDFETFEMMDAGDEELIPMADADADALESLPELEDVDELEIVEEEQRQSIEERLELFTLSGSGDERMIDNNS